MLRWSLVAALLWPLIAMGQMVPSPIAPPAPAPALEWAVFFSPHGGCTEAVVRELEGAHRSVYVQAYSFTSGAIARALLAAAKRGVQVSIILDRSNVTGKYSAADLVSRAGIPTVIDASHAIAHNKVMVIDETVVLTGSFNFTTAAEAHNAENLLVIHDTTLAEAYLTNWRRHLAHSSTYRKPE